MGLVPVFGVLSISSAYLTIRHNSSLKGTFGKYSKELKN